MTRPKAVYPNGHLPFPVNPQTRQPVNPQTRQPVNPQTRQPVNPQTRKPANPSTRKPAMLMVTNDITMLDAAGLLFVNQLSPLHST